jgi:hypothetical protein
MPRLSTAIDRANAILRAHGTPFRLREGHGTHQVGTPEKARSAAAQLVSAIKTR